MVRKIALFALLSCAMAFAAASCATTDTAVLEKCKTETSQLKCQTCCEDESWEKGSVSTGECECRRDS